MLSHTHTYIHTLAHRVVRGGLRVSGGKLNDSSECCILNAIRGKLKLFSVVNETSLTDRHQLSRGAGIGEGAGTQGIASS